MSQTIHHDENESNVRILCFLRAQQHEESLQRGKSLAHLSHSTILATLLHPFQAGNKESRSRIPIGTLLRNPLAESLH